MADPVEQFCSITATDRATAAQFLEMAGGDVGNAVALFLDNSDRPTEPPRPEPAPSYPTTNTKPLHNAPHTFADHSKIL